LGDLVHGVRPSAVATVVDRATRYAMVVALPDGYKADAVASALIEHMGRLPEQQRSLTWDRGQEMADHARIAAALDLRSISATRIIRGIRGIRGTLHRSADLRTFSQDELDVIAARINQRPRRVLDRATPAELFDPDQLHKARHGRRNSLSVPLARWQQPLGLSSLLGLLVQPQVIVDVYHHPLRGRPRARHVGCGGNDLGPFQLVCLAVPCQHGLPGS